MATPTPLEGAFTPGDIAERELTHEPLPGAPRPRIRARDDLEAELPKDRAPEPPPVDPQKDEA